MTVITGGFGFLGWHLACRLRALAGVEPTRLGREDLADTVRLERGLAGAEVVFHLAGVNRAATPDEVEEGNVDIARRTAEAVRRNGRPVRLVYANSIQADLDNPYGRGKRRAAEELAAAVGEVGGRFVDVLLPNLFGEHGRPRYNSFVATFSDAVARGEQPKVLEDREVPLLHAQRAAQALVDAAGGDDSPAAPGGAAAHRDQRTGPAARLPQPIRRSGRGPRPRRPFRRGPVQHLPFLPVPGGLSDVRPAARRPAWAAG